MYWKRLLLFFTLLLAVFNNLYADWTNLIDNYSRNDYNAGSQNWQITQKGNQWMYFANKTGILEFNGIDWNLYPLNNNSDARSLLYSSKTHRIYLGGINEFGYLEPDISGKMKYHCLSNLIPKKEISFGNIWKIYELDNAIYFCGDQTIVKWINNSYTTIYCPDKIDCSNVINNTLYIGTSSGVYILAGESFYSYPHIEKLKNKKLRGILPFQNKILVATALDGLFLLDDNGLSAFQTEADPFIRKNGLFSIASNEHYVAIGTVLNGVVLITPEGKAISYFNETHGLQNNTILSLYFDLNDNLWLGLDNGIDYIALNYPITNLYKAPNFYGAGYAAALYNNKLYLGTNRGLYYIEWPIPLTEEAPHLKLVENMQGQVWNLRKMNDQLMCCLDRGLFIIEKNKIQQMNIQTGVWDFQLMLRNKDKAWISTYNGFFSVEWKNNQWQNPTQVPDFWHSIINFEELNEKTLLVRNHWDELIKISFNDSLNRIIKTKEYGPEAFPVNSYISKFKNEIKLSAPDGFYKLDKDENFVKDEELNQQLRCNVKNNFYKSLWDINNNTWALGDHIVSAFYSNGNRFVSCHHRMPLIANFEKLLILGDSMAIIPNENGFALWNTSSQFTQHAYSLQIIDVRITHPTDSLIYTNDASEKKVVPEITYDNNSLRFRYYLINYSDKSDVFFRYQLDNEPWSEFTLSNTKEYSNLKIGKHQFQIETQLKDGTVLSDSFSFVILSPWYRTNTAYSIYVLLLILLLTGLWYLDDHRIKRKERQIELAQEKEMMRKEEAYRADSKKKEQEIIQLKNEHLEMEVKHKNQELASTAIHLARKNETLTEIKEDLSKISENIKVDNFDITAVKRRILRVNTKIEDNIQQDDSLNKFEEHFDLVHNNFMQRLSEKYPSLTMNERKMCAFIKMQLSSKEIAPLLNISIRGVETLRYRLRKKLDLNRDESLTLFLNNF